jgi:hypothetical protein
MECGLLWTNMLPFYNLCLSKDTNASQFGVYTMAVLSYKSMCFLTNFIQVIQMNKLDNLDDTLKYIQN